MKAPESVRRRFRVAVVGGGIFGATAAWVAAEAGYTVTLFERQARLFAGASGANTLRVHRGYHYPLSPETARAAQQAYPSFAEVYGSSAMAEVAVHYAVARDGSRVSAADYRRFLDELALPYQEDWPSIVRRERHDWSIRAPESFFEPERLFAVIRQRLRETGVEVALQAPIRAQLDGFDFVVHATYADNNDLIDDRAELQRDYQFELCEMPVFRLPPSWAGKAPMVLYGPFVAFNPFGSSGLHQLVHVDHMVLHRHVGRRAEIPAALQARLRQGLLAPPPDSRAPQILGEARAFFHDLDDVEHVGSTYGLRAVLPDRDHDDARPTEVTMLSSRECALFSGKIVTCVAVAHDVRARIDRRAGLA